MSTCSAQSSTPPGCSTPIEPFPVQHLSDVQAPPPEQKWLVEHLWLNAGVGILGGHAKVCKTFLACELALAVASGSLALGHFNVSTHGPVLFYGAEDNLPDLRVRFEGLACARKLSLENLPVYLLDIPALRLDQKNHLLRLQQAIAVHKPHLLVLDPFVRMVGAVDENSATDVSAVLASLRNIQRSYNIAVLVVHHARKSPATYPGHALRGSSDFAAWSDSNLYLARRPQHLSLTIEHRNAPAPDPLKLQLATMPTPHLQLLDHASQQIPLIPDPLQTQILNLLEQSNRPLPTVELQRSLRRRKASIVEVLERFRAQGTIQRTPQGWTLNKSQ